jgi:long-chain fatty acid transport protein
VAAADDASTVYFNPAGMTELRGPEMTMGVDLIRPSASLTDRGSFNTSTGAYLANPTGGGVSPANGSNGGDPGSATPVPHFYLTTPIGDTGFSAGLGVSAPFGLISQYKSDSFARYDSETSILETVDISPSLARKVSDWLSIGAGVDIGLLFKPADGTKIGISFREGMNHHIHGTVQFAGLAGPLAANNGTIAASADLDLPDIVAAGISQQITDRLKLLGEVDYYQWSNFKQIDVKLANGAPDLVTPENYRNTWSAAVGGEYQLTDQLKLRAGVKWDETPTQDAFRDTRVPDGNRIWLAGGFAWTVNDRIDVDVSYAHIFVQSNNVNVTRSFYAGAPFPVPTTSTVAATSHAKIDIASIGFNYHF